MKNGAETIYNIYTKCLIAVGGPRDFGGRPQARDGYTNERCHIQLSLHYFDTSIKSYIRS